jgi:hypothetical protein
MTTPSEYVTGFTIDNDAPMLRPPERTPPNLVQLCRENDALVADLARFSENLVSEAAIRRKYRDILNDEAWTTLGKDDLLVEMVEAERVRRIRNGAAKREKAQNFVTAAPDILNGIMNNPRESARHRIDASKVLNGLADPGPEAAAETEKVVIRIDLSGDAKLKDPKDILIIEAAPRPSTPKQIEDDHSERPSDEWRK